VAPKAKEVDASAWSSSTEHADRASEAGESPSGSESDDVDISTSPPPAKRTRLAAAAKKSTQFTDYHAAECLMQLRKEDAQLGAGMMGNNKRKASLM
jgi:hypothetical protein